MGAVAGVFPSALSGMRAPRAALKSYLMAKYDTGWGQDTTPPFLMENDVLMDGEAAQ